MNRTLAVALLSAVGVSVGAQEALEQPKPKFESSAPNVFPKGAEDARPPASTAQGPKIQPGDFPEPVPGIPEKFPEVVPEKPPKVSEPPPVKEKAPEPHAKPEAKKADRTQLEWSFLRAVAEDSHDEVREAAIRDVEAFYRREALTPLGEEALQLLAALNEKKGDYEQAAVNWLKLVYAYPDSKLAFQAKRSYQDLVDRKMPRKLRSSLSGLARAPGAPGERAVEISDRLAELVHRLVEVAGEPFADPIGKEIEDFWARFPDYAQGDRILRDLAETRTKKSRRAAALVAHKKLLALYPQSAYRPQAQWSAGEIYADLREHDKAVDAFQELVERYPKDAHVQPALEKTAQLLRDKLKRYDDAIKAYERLSRDFRSSSGVAALQKAAEIARKDLKDFAREIELRRKLVEGFADAKEAPEELFSVAEIYEDDVKDAEKALAAYQEVAAKYPTHKLAKKAQDRAAKLAQKK